MLDMIGNMLLLEQALQTLGAVLAQRGQRFETELLAVLRAFGVEEADGIV